MRLKSLLALTVFALPLGAAPLAAAQDGGPLSNLVQPPAATYPDDGLPVQIDNEINRPIILPAEQYADAAATPSETLVGLLLAADSALGAGRTAEAADYYARASEMAEGSARDYLREQGFIAAVLSGQIDQALTLLPENDDGAQTVRRLAALVEAVDSLKRGEGQRAATMFGGELIGQPYRNAAVLLRPWAMAAAGDAERAVPPAVTRGDQLSQVISRYSRALLLERAGRFEEADEEFRAVIDSEVDFPDFNLTYGAFLERRDRRAEAAAVYQAVLDEYPGSIRAQQALARVSGGEGLAGWARRLTRGRAASAPPAMPTVQEGAAQIMVATASATLNQGSYETAMAYYQMARHLNPERSDVLIMLGNFEDRLDSPAQARAYFEQVPETSPDYIDARIRLSEAWVSDDPARALAIALETVRVAPNSRNAKVSLAGHLFANGRHGEVIDLLNGVIREMGPGEGWNLYYLRARSLEAQGDWPGAERDLLMALEIQPNHPELMNYLGYTWADRGERLDDALQLLQRAARAQPNAGHIVDSLGWVYYRLGQNDKAIEELEKAVELEPGDPVVNDHLGDAYLTAGRRLEAVFQWERVLTLDPDDNLRAAVLEKVEAEKPGVTRIAVTAPDAEPANP